MSAGGKYGSSNKGLHYWLHKCVPSVNIQTRFSKRREWEAKFGPASSSAEQDTDPGSQPPLTNGATLHRCKYCRDVVFDFDQSEDDIRRILRSLVKDKSLRKDYTAQTFTWIMQREPYRHFPSTVLNLTADRLRSGKRNGCKLYQAVLHNHYDPSAKHMIIIMTFEFATCDLSFTDIIGGDSTHACTFSLSVPQDSTLSEIISKRPVNRNAWSNNSREQVRHWMERCEKNHTLCRPEQNDFRPSNLIEISKSAEETVGFSLRLTRDFESMPRYVALSYCWGGDQPLKLLKSNMDELRQDVPYDKMPATLQDAARVAFDLGFRYLWIDALCLIQDLGANEGHTLVAEIPEVYRCASLTIAAYSSPRVDHGFLRPRDTRYTPEIRDTFGLGEEQYECRVQINNLCQRINDPYRNSGSAMLKLYTYDFCGAAINLRGWTLQERILSRRYLIFSSLFTEWTCYKSHGSRALTDGVDAGRSPGSPGPGTSFSAVWTMIKPPSVPGESKFYVPWHRAVREYTTRTLSFSRDFPIAISALAKDFGEAHDYAAGLWLPNLCQELCWYNDDAHENDIETDNTFYAPTWSWWNAARGPVKFSQKGRTDARFRLLDHTLKLDHPSAPFGYVSEASLRVEACCGRATVDCSNRDLYLHTNTYVHTILYGSSGELQVRNDNPKGFTWYPNSIPFGEDFSVRIIPLLHMNDYPRYCLVVRECPGEIKKAQQYYRIALLEIPRETWGLNEDGLRFVEWLKVQPVEILTLV